MRNEKSHVVTLGEHRDDTSALFTLERVAREELQNLHIRLVCIQVLLGLLPLHVGNRLRAYGLRLTGFKLGRGVMIYGMPRITGGARVYQHLSIGARSHINARCVFDLGGPITIGAQVSLGHEVMILTTTHEMGGPSFRAGHPRSSGVTIGDGAWLGARCTVLPGITIGPGAVAAAGAVVTKDVPPHTLVGGTPARVIKQLPMVEYPQQ